MKNLFFINDMSYRDEMEKLRKNIQDSFKDTGSFLNDIDRDGVPNFNDCQPFNPSKQGSTHSDSIDKWKRTSGETWKHTSGRFSVYIDKQPSGWKVAGVRENQPSAPEVKIANGLSSKKQAEKEAREYMKANDADWL